MQKLGRMWDHLWLANRMARLTRTDLVKAHKSGELSQKDWAGLVQTCRGCPWAKECPRWLTRQELGPDGQAPRQCPNRARYAAIRAGARVRSDAAAP